MISQYQILIIKLKDSITIISPQPFCKSRFITQSVDSFSEIKLVYLIKNLELVLYDFFIINSSTFLSHPFCSIFTRMLVFYYVLDSLIRIWREFIFLGVSRSFRHYSHFWLSYPWNVIRLHRSLSRLSLSS